MPQAANPRRTLITYVELVIAVFLWGSMYPAGKPVLAVVPAEHVALVRAVVAFVVLGGLVIATGRGRLLIEELRTRPLASAGLGILSFFLSSILAMMSLQYLPASVVGIITNTSPLWLAIGTVVLLRPADSARMIAGATLALIGVGLVLMRSESPTALLVGSNLNVLGAVISLACSVVIALSSLWARKVLPGRDPIVVTCLACGWGAIPLVAMAALNGGAAPIVTASPDILVLLLFLGVGCTAINFGLWYHVLQTVSVARASAFQYLTPFFSAILAFALLGEEITWALVVGGVTIVFGVSLTQERRRRALASSDRPTEIASVADQGS